MRPFLLLSATLADGEAVWTTSCEEVRAAWLAALDRPGEARVEVNPFGSNRPGVALLAVTQPAGTDRLACVHDKATGRAEFTAPFAPKE
ncbi:hypothetical protein [Rubellimicrobium aerolatum]|uniref:Uncharacterized protein n=1 Tax=Rubellimicrobium aerolatum TaxID=490979 RepID=A0ABW0SGU3_9RHOB|nr:hypothetical protein [Rubellimicrobium aerolatum]MBP1807481.1 hypothetical protein [Rubellimicrobium aerolatum]